MELFYIEIQGSFALRRHGVGVKSVAIFAPAPPKYKKDLWLLYRDLWLLCGDMELFCGNMGLFYREMQGSFALRRHGVGVKSVAKFAPAPPKCHKI
jgi:hypothetical protein